MNNPVNQKTDKYQCKYCHIHFPVFKQATVIQKIKNQ